MLLVSALLSLSQLFLVQWSMPSFCQILHSYVLVRWPVLSTGTMDGLSPAVVAWFVRVSVFHSVNSVFPQRTVDLSRLGHVYGTVAIIMLLKPIRTHDPDQNPP